jgi:hypothetical protein
VIWPPTEEITHQGYSLPRLEALTRHTWVAYLIVGFFWTAQHCALPRCRSSPTGDICSSVSLRFFPESSS